MTKSILPEDRRRWTTLMVIVLAVGVGWVILSRVPSAAANVAGSSAPRQGFSAPDLTLGLLGGGQVTLSDLRGEVVVLNFWASWCLPCRAEMPAIEEVYQDYRDKGVVVLAINTTYQDSERDAATFVREFDLTFPVLLDRDGTVSRQYALNGLPTTFFIDRRGIIHSVVVGGPMSEATIRSKIEDLLSGVP